MSGVAGWQSPLAFWGQEAMTCASKCDVPTASRHATLRVAGLELSTGMQAQHDGLMLVKEISEKFDSLVQLARKHCVPCSQQAYDGMLEVAHAQQWGRSLQETEDQFSSWRTQQSVYCSKACCSDQRNDPSSQSPRKLG